MSEKGIVSWDRIFYGSVVYVCLGLLTGIFNKSLSFVFWIMLISMWSEIPGFININLNEINISEFFLVLIAIHFGGIIGGLLGAIHCWIMPLYSRMWKPTFSIFAGISTFIAVGLSSIFYFNVFNQNLLWTLYAYTAILFVSHGIMTLFVTTGEFFEEVRLGIISLLLAYLTNLMYVYALEDWAMGLFKPLPHFPTSYKLIIIAVMLAIGGVALVNRKKK
jgi:hypothetical protein